MNWVASHPFSEKKKLKIKKKISSLNSFGIASISGIPILKLLHFGSMPY